MARRVVRRSSGPRRETVWGGHIPLIDTVSATLVLILTLNAAALALRPFTIVRTHLEVEFGSDQVAASEVQIAAIGLAIVSDQASAIGITAIPTPITDLDSDLWFMHQPMINSMFVGDATGVKQPFSSRYSIDSKAMRRVNADEDMVFVLEGASAGSGVTITTMGRFLLKLH